MIWKTYLGKVELNNVSILSLTDANGAAAFKASYDACGKQTVTINTFKFHRGYTGHEHLPMFGLINMNARLYDPAADSRKRLYSQQGCRCYGGISDRITRTVHRYLIRI
jgi:hypothetical protein